MRCLSISISRVLRYACFSISFSFFLCVSTYNQGPWIGGVRLLALHLICPCKSYKYIISSVMRSAELIHLLLTLFTLLVTRVQWLVIGIFVGAQRVTLPGCPWV